MQNNKYSAVSNHDLVMIDNTAKGIMEIKPRRKKMRIVNIAGRDKKVLEAGDLPDGTFDRIMHKGAFIITLPDTRRKVPVIYPYSAVCLLKIINQNGGIEYGTGFFISPTCVITAGHCVFNNGSWMRSITVIPGATGGVEPFGRAASGKFKSVEGWTINADSDFDYGAVILSDNSLYNKTGATLGARPSNGNEAIRLTGYPSDKKGTQWEDSGVISSETTHRIFYVLDTIEGDSGGPVFTTNDAGESFAVGIHTNGPALSYATRITPELLNRFFEWSKQ